MKINSIQSDNTQFYEEQPEEDTLQQKKHETAMWALDIARHLMIAAASLDARTRWRLTIDESDMGTSQISDDERARENIADACYKMFCDIRPGSTEDFLRKSSQYCNIGCSSHRKYDYPFIMRYLPEALIRDIIDRNKESNKSKERQEDASMSFTGVMLLDDCIMAFGDSKGTRVDASGNKYEETGRTVQKVFRYDECLLVTSGLNEVSFNDSTMRIEDYINDCISRHIPMHDMLNVLTSSGTLEEASRLNVGDRIVPYGYQFIVGGFDLLHNAPYVTSIHVDADGVKERPRKYKQEGRIIEVHCLVDLFHEAFLHLLYQLDSQHKTTYNAVRLVLESWMTEETAVADKILDYNSVGLPLQIEILRN